MKDVSKLKYLLLILVIGVAFGVLNYLISQLLVGLELEIPETMVGGGTAGAGFVAIIFLINRSIRRGGCTWLLKASVGDKTWVSYFGC